MFTEQEYKARTKAQDRTIAQVEAMELKKRGYKVTKMLDEFDNIVAFGYTDREKSLNVPSEITIYNVNESNYNFIFWN